MVTTVAIEKMKRSRERIVMLIPGQSLSSAKGLSLIETIVALAIFGLVAVVFLSGLTMSSKAVMVSHARVAAERLAKRQMEDIKAQDYATSYSEITVPQDLVDQGYDIEPSVEDIHSGELQKITVTVTHNGEVVFQLEDYKLNG